MSIKKIRVGILFGGKSAEHEISIQSARSVIENLDKKKYEVVPIGINKAGTWLLNHTSNNLLNTLNPTLAQLNQSNKESGLVLQSAGTLIDTKSRQSHGKIDVAFPVLHGPYGEDGSIQGLLKLAGVPYVGASVLGSAVGMDKDVMKRLLKEADIPVAKFLAFHSHEKISFTAVKKTLGLPVFIKPANLGSSVGVSKVKDKASFEKAITEAFEYDTKILIEEFIEGREIECAVLGNDDPVASGVGEIIPHQEFYSYDAKYIDADGAALEIPAKIPDETREHVRDLAIQTFKALSCEGLGRVDLFLKQDGTLLVNEINTMPGFTKISMYPKLWEASGISYTDLIDRLIQLAIERFQREQKLKTSH